MKIFHVISSLKIGGAESALFNFLEKSVNDKNKHILAYFYPGPNLEKINKLGFKTYHIKGLIWKYDPIAYKNLKNIIKKNNPNIIHSALWSANIFSKLIAKSLGIPIICDIHSNYLFDGKLRRIIEKPIILNANKYIAVSESVKQGFIDSFKKQATKLEQKIIVIPNAIDTQKKNKQKLTREHLGLNKNDFVIGAVGRLEKIKSYDLLIKSFATVCNKINIKLHPIKLCIVGSGSQEKKLKKLVKNLNLQKHIIFTGMRNDVYRIYPLFDCLTISSKSEGLSITLLEAMSFGLPIISTFQKGKHDVLINNVNGLLVSSQNQNELAIAIEKLYKNPKIRNLMGISNKNLINNKFSIDRLVSKYNKLYNNLTKNKVKHA